MHSSERHLRFYNGGYPVSFIGKIIKSTHEGGYTNFFNSQNLLFEESLRF